MRSYRENEKVEQVTQSTATARPVEPIAGPPLALRRVGRGSASYDIGKRIVDVVGAGLALVLLSPLMVGIALAISADSGLPILYRCQRLGRGGRTITVHKFRTMFDGSHHHLRELLTHDEELRLAYEVSRKLKEDPRRTRIGILLRRTSLDELPQLWNVLRGEMSLIGPRPYMLHELRGVAEAADLLSIRPGITGLWQVSGRSELTFDQRIAIESSYVRRRSWRLDLSVAARTLGAVVSGRGAY